METIIPRCGGLLRPNCHFQWPIKHWYCIMKHFDEEFIVIKTLKVKYFIYPFKCVRTYTIYIIYNIYTFLDDIEGVLHGPRWLVMLNANLNAPK